MSYSYEKELPALMTPKGMIKIVDTLLLARRLCKKSGAVRAGNIIGVGDSFHSFGAIEFLTRNNYLRVVYDDGPGQDMILVMS